MKSKYVWRAGLSLIILAAGAFGMKFMIASKKAQQKQKPVNPGALVEIQSLSEGNVPVIISTHGTVQPHRVLDIAPQVGGIVKFLPDELRIGGYFRKGDLLFEIDPVDYELRLKKMQSLVVKAEFELARIEGQARIARMEWDRMEHDPDEKPNPLVLYEPQLNNAKAVLESARADVELQELSIRRCQVFAPFNCMVKTERLEEGQLVMAGQAVLNVRGTDVADILIPVTFEDLEWVQVPRLGSTGSSATVLLKSPEHIWRWHGKIDRSLGEVDPKGRMFRLIVQIRDPYGLGKHNQVSEQRGGVSNRFLAEGLFVDVELHGKTIEHVFKIPTSALRESTHIWIKTDKDELAVRDITILRNQGDDLLVRGDIHEGESLVLTYLQGGVNGMKLRTREEL
jgi:RND family efflux transporter MFP subunit